MRPKSESGQYREIISINGAIIGVLRTAITTTNQLVNYLPHASIMSLNAQLCIDLEPRE